MQPVGNLVLPCNTFRMLVPQCFQKLSLSWSLKLRMLWQKGKGLRDSGKGVVSLVSLLDDMVVF